MHVGEIVYITHGPLGGYYSPDEDAWPIEFQTKVPAGARGEIVGKHSLNDWWIARFYDDSAGDTGNKFVPVGPHHVTHIIHCTVCGSDISPQDGLWLDTRGTPFCPPPHRGRHEFAPR